MSLTPKSKKRGRSKYDPKKELGFHKNSSFKPKTGKRSVKSSFITHKLSKDDTIKISLPENIRLRKRSKI